MTPELQAELKLRGKAIGWITAHLGCTESELLQALPEINSADVQRWIDQTILRRHGGNLVFNGSWR